MLKKCLALCLALTLLGAGALAGGQIVLSAREDHPRFYSTGESGDPEAARGLRFSLGMILGSTNGELGWDVSGRPAENVDAETALRYEAGGRAYPSEPSPYSSGLELSYPLLSSFGSATNTSFTKDQLTSSSFLGIIWPLVEEAAKDAAPGDTVVRYFPLADYYDALPMTLGLDLGDLWVHESYDFDRDENRVADLYGTLSGMFSLALPAGAWARVKVELNGVGAPCSVDYDLVTGDLSYWEKEDGSTIPGELRARLESGTRLPGAATNVMACSIADNHTLWLAAEVDSDDGTRLPFVSGAAPGLYRIDYTLGEGDESFSTGSYRVKTLKAGEPVLCWESEPGWESRTLTYIEDGQRLVLTQSRAGEETGGRGLLFDNTGTLLQVIPLFDETPDNIEPILSDGAMVFFSQSWGGEAADGVTEWAPADGGRYVTVLDRGENGLYAPALALTLSAHESPSLYNLHDYSYPIRLYDPNIAWNGETRTLAVAQGRWYSMEVTDQSEDPVMEVAVLNETGLVFTRRYGCDLTQPFAAEDFPAIYLDDMRGIELSWQ